MFGQMIKKWWFWPLVLGLFVRLILIPITLHSDLWVFVSSGYIFTHEKVLNIYDHIIKLPQDSVFLKHIGNPYEYFIYPPLAYITFGIFHLPISRFIDPDFITNFWVDSLSIYSNSGLFFNLFLFKLPYLLVDIASGFYLAKIFEKEIHQKY